MKISSGCQMIVAGSAIMILMNSCSLSPSGHSVAVHDPAKLRLEARNFKEPVSVTAAVVTGVAWAAQNPETVKKVATGIYGVVKRKKPEPLPQRSADSQGAFGYAGDY